MPSPITIFDLLRNLLNATWDAIRVEVSSTLPLPSGAATSAEQVTQTSLLTQIELNTDGLVRVNAPVRIDYTSNNVTTAAYTQLVASLSGATKAIQIFDSSGRALVLATGAAASEVDQIYIEPGGTGPVLIAIPAGTRISVKAVDANATQGQLLVAFLG